MALDVSWQRPAAEWEALLRATAEARRARGQRAA